MTATRPAAPAALPRAGDGSEPGGSQPGGSRWLMLAVLLTGQFMALLDTMIVTVAMPTIGADLHASGSALQLVLGGYLIAYAMLLITGARLGNLYGLRRVYLAGIVVFTVSSLACGLAPDTGALIAFRFGQGAGAALMIPQVFSVIQLRFSGKARAAALSAYAAVLSSGTVAGLVLGGLLVSANLFGYSWRPVFLLNVPAGIAVNALLPRVLPADRPARARRLDLAGLAIAVPAVVLLVVPLVLGHQAGWPSWCYASMAAGAALAGLFVTVERRIAARGGDPLLSLDVWHAPGIRSGLLALACAVVVLGGLLFTIMLYLQAGLGEGALRAGLTLLPLGVVFGLCGYYWRALPARIQHLLPLAGLALVAAAVMATARAASGGGQPGPLLWLALAGYGAGMGLTMSLLAHALVHVPPRRAADASGLLTTVIQLGNVAGIAVFGSVYLSLAGQPHRGGGTPTSVTARHAGHALASTYPWMALLAAAGMAAAFALSRSSVDPRLQE